MALWLNGTDQYVLIAASANLNLPAGDWALGWWQYSPLAGTENHYLISTGGWGAANSLNFRVRPSNPTGGYDFYIRDGSGNYITATNQDGGTFSATWQSVLLQRASDVFYVYVDGVEVHSVSCASIGAITAASGLCIGNVITLDNRWFGGGIAEPFKADAAFDATQRAALAAGACPRLFSPAVWPPLYNDYVERVASLTVTPYNTPTFVTHPTIKDPGRRRRLLAA